MNSVHKLCIFTPHPPPQASSHNSRGFFLCLFIQWRRLPWRVTSIQSIHWPFGWILGSSFHWRSWSSQVRGLYLIVINIHCIYYTVYCKTTKSNRNSFLTDIQTQFLNIIPYFTIAGFCYTLCFILYALYFMLYTLYFYTLCFLSRCKWR